MLNSVNRKYTKPVPVFWLESQENFRKLIAALNYNLLMISKTDCQPEAVIKPSHQYCHSVIQD